MTASAVKEASWRDGSDRQGDKRASAVHKPRKAHADASSDHGTFGSAAASYLI